MVDLRMDLPDVITLRSGERWSETWFETVWMPMFHPRRCDRCGVVKDTMGAFIGGTTKFANYLLFGYPAEIVEKMMVALNLSTYCKPCFLKLRYNGSGPPSPFRLSRKKENLDG